MAENLGPFVLLDVIGQGGMGKVWKAYDTINDRNVALKVIKDKLINNPKSKKRFLQEAYIHAKLSHPAIIPIHGIQIHEEGIGYSMPFIEGQTLKHLLMHLKDNPNFMPLKERLRVIMTVLEALEYTHNQGYVHRDIKADNIFIGKNNDVYLFDWGLATKINQPEDDQDGDTPKENTDMTKPGKIPGTLTHLAPERALGIKGSIQSDIFSLGVVLYQLLTFKIPFYRKDLEHFKKNAQKETFDLPSSLNLKEDIDESLDLICQRALHNDLSKRYKYARDFMYDLKKVLDGIPVWKDPLVLDLQSPSQWLYQDTLPLGSYLALTQKSLSWGLLSVPYVELIDNFRLQIKLPKQDSIFKIYLNLAKETKSFNFEQCYILEVDVLNSVSLHKVFALLQKYSYNLDSQDYLLLDIQRIENHYYVFVNGSLAFDFIAKVPSICPHLGIVIEDPSLEFSSIEVFSSSSSKQISCLKLGDNLVFHKYFDLARQEYQKIVSSFQDHAEGLEALFRIGYSYILEAKTKKSQQKKLLHQGALAFEAFKKHKASPWEYWGKALCYLALNEKKEMIKCFELGFRKYPRHVFTQELKEELVVQFTQKSVKDKKLALLLAFCALRYLDDFNFYSKYPALIDSLEEELAKCFILLDEESLSKKQKLIFSLAYVLNEQSFLEEVLIKSSNRNEKINAAIILCHLNSKIMKPQFMKTLADSLNIPNIYKEDFLSLKQECWILAKLALSLYGKISFESPPPASALCNFLTGLLGLIKPTSFTPLSYDDYETCVIQNLEKAKTLSKQEMVHTFKLPFFQESEHFIRSNFIISLIEKKPLDYFGPDKSWLEFAIKALF